jgi:GNAT superfamily N-acetyltransferase
MHMSQEQVARAALNELPLRLPHPRPAAHRSYRPRLWTYHRPQIRRLDPGDENELTRLLFELDAMSRLCRFRAWVSDSCLVQYARRALASSVFNAGASLDGRLRGFADVYETCDASIVEAAFLVEPGWRDHGIGMALLTAARQWAEGSARSTLRMVIAQENWPMRMLAEKAGARLDFIDGEILADLALRRPFGPEPEAALFASA